MVGEARDGAERRRVQHRIVVQAEQVAVAALDAVPRLSQVSYQRPNGVAAVLEQRRVGGNGLARKDAPAVHA